MSWAQELYAVYEKAAALPSDGTPLLPISHTTAKAQLEVTIDSKGNFLDASPINDESDAVTIIPATEDSGARSSGVCPHPFADKLVYIAGDYCDFCSPKKNDADKFSAYIEQLRKWRDSEFTHPSANALYAYLSKGTLIADLVSARVFTVNDSGKLTSDKIQKTIVQSDCFIRFIVIGSAGEERTWLDRSLYDKFIAYNASLQGDKAMCYATGNVTYCTYKHPSKILNAGDKGKLFSANDDTGYSYRGRFLDKTQAFSIGYEFSQKMHNGLKWLIERQGVRLGSLTLVVWDSELDDLPNICSGSQSLLSKNTDNTNSDDDDLDWNDSFPETFASYKEALSKSIIGAKDDLKPTDKAMMLALDEATTGRVSLNMYAELVKSELYDNIGKWHLNTAWNRYSFKQKKYYVGSFALIKIAEFAFGTEQNGKVTCKPEIKSSTVMRLIPCVTGGRNLPKDILNQLVNRTSKRSAYGDAWNTLLEIACGMIRKHYIENGKEYDMALDRNCSDRSYLFGRFLAWAEVAERTTFRDGEDHQTNAERFFEKFSANPARTIEMIEQRLKPYLNRMNPGKRRFYENEHDEIMGKLNENDFISDRKLDPLYLLGYSHERLELRKGNKDKTENSEEV